MNTTIKHKKPPKLVKFECGKLYYYKDWDWLVLCAETNNEILKGIFLKATSGAETINRVGTYNGRISHINENVFELFEGEVTISN